MQEIEKNKEKRQKEREEYEKVLAHAEANSTSPMPLYKKLEQKFEQKVLMPELQKKKQMLSSIRDFHKPLDFGSLKEHARAYSQRRAESLEKRRLEREKKIREDMQTYELNKHKSMFLNNILEEEREKKELELIKSAELADFYEKRKNYGALVQQMHKPVISRKKQIEIELNKKKLKHIPRISIVSGSQSQPTGLLASDSSDRLASPTQSIGKSEYRSYFSENRGIQPIRKWKENEMLLKPKNKPMPKVTDYLLQKRIENQERSQYGEFETKSRKPVEWKSLVENMAAKDKIGRFILFYFRSGLRYGYFYTEHDRSQSSRIKTIQQSSNHFNNAFCRFLVRES